MSAIRSGKNRRSTSRAAQSPYARPAAKKLSWSITGFLSYLNPLRSRSPAESSESLDSFDGEDESFESQAPSVAASLSARAEQIAVAQGTGNMFARPYSRQSILTPPPTQTPSKAGPPQTPVRSYHLEESSSPAKNLEAVSNFLAERAGQAISDVEVEGLISLINKSTPPDHHEPFRFTSSTPSTPVRGNSPLFANTNGISFSFATPTAQTTTTPSPRKTLSKNPNGRYRWEGGGSSKLPRSRNRYSSPAFGPSRSSNDRIVLRETQSTSEVPKDTKRRRVGDDATISSASPSGPTTNGTHGDSSNSSYRSSAPDPSPTRTSQALPFPVSSGPPTPTRTLNGTPAKANGVPSSSRLRPPQLSAKPTVPVVPSPLRQAWSGGSSSSQSDSPPSQPQAPPKQTKAANFMAELIKEVTPPKRPDLSNPYQTASPVGKVGPPKPRARRVRATGKPAPPTIKDNTAKEKEKEPEKTDEKEYSPQAIIEATLPKGSKRSRPPAHLQKPSTSTPELSPSVALFTPQPSSESQRTRSSYIVEEVNDDDEEEQKRTTKRSKPHLNGRGLASTSGRKSAMTIEEVDINMQTTVEKPAEITPPSVSVTGTPSTTSSAASSATTGKSMFAPFKSTSVPKEPSKLRFSYQPEVGTPPTPSSASAFTPELKFDVPSPSLIYSTLPTVMDDKEIVTKRPPTSIPPKEPLLSPPNGSTPRPLSPVSSKATALSAPVDSLPTFVFSVRAFVYPTSEQHMKALKEAQTLPKSSLPIFDFTKPAAAKSIPPPVKAFDWAAAGVKPAPSGAGASWTCSVCMLSNPATATAECTICGTAR